MAAPLVQSGEWLNPSDIPVQNIAEETPRRVHAAAPAKLNCVLPFNERDIPKAIALLKRCAQGGVLDRTLFLLPFKGLKFYAVEAAARKAFSEVRIISDAEGVVSDWQGDQKIRDAAGPNSMFRQAAWFFYLHQALGPWLYLEPDCEPAGGMIWLGELEREYLQVCREKPFMGFTMNMGDDSYLNGVAIYPANAVQLAPSLVNRTMWTEHPEFEVAFDVAGAKEVLRQAHITNKIQDNRRLHSISVTLIHNLYNGEVAQLAEHCGGGNAAAEDGGSIPPLAGESEFVQRDISCRAGLLDRREVDIHLSLGDQIRHHCNALAEIEGGAPSRKARILYELRKRRLIPQPQRKRK